VVCSNVGMCIRDRTCGMCKADWCWLCHRIISSPADHYSPGNFLGCPSSQFTDVAPLQYENILADMGDSVVVRIIRSLVWIAFILLCRMVPTAFAVVVGGACYLVGTVLLTPLLFCLQTYYQKYDRSMYPYVGLVLSVFVLSICCVAVDLLWIPCLTTTFVGSHVVRTRSLPSLESLNDHVLLYSLVISFLMLIDIEG
jgi:hypothetical protein